MNFAFPMILLIVSTVYFEIDLLRGALLTCFVTVVVYWIQGILSFETQVEAITPYMTIVIFPAVIFAVMAFLTFATS
jgi:hypothetical protein